MEQQNKQPIQEKTESKSSIKTNWKYLAIVIVFAVIVAAAILLSKTMQPAPVEPSSIVQRTLPPSPQSQPLDTANWQTYRNEEFGFEVKYPSEWTVRHEAQYVKEKSIEVRIGYTSPDLHSYTAVSIERRPLTDDESTLEEVVQKHKEDTLPIFIEKFGIGSLREEKITFDRIPAVQFSFIIEQGRLYPHILAVTKNDILLFSLDNSACEDILRCNTVFDEILSTFRLIPISSQTSTPSYTSGVVREFTLTAKQKQWRFDPEIITVNKGDKIILTLINEDSYDHGFAIELFDIDKRMPGNSTLKIEFVATKVGTSPFYSSVPSGKGIVDGKERSYFDMVGKIIVSESK